MKDMRSEPTAEPAAPALQQDATWAALAELSSDMLALLDTQGHIVWVNPAFVRTSGCAAAKAVGQSLADLAGFVGASSAWTAVSKLLAEGANVDPVELPWRHPSGDTRWGRLTARALQVAAGCAHRTAVSLQDLSEQHRLA